MDYVKEIKKKKYNRKIKFKQDFSRNINKERTWIWAPRALSCAPRIYAQFQYNFKLVFQSIIHIVHLNTTEFTASVLPVYSCNQSIVVFL